MTTYDDYIFFTIAGSSGKFSAGPQSIPDFIGGMFSDVEVRNGEE